jgi:Na+/H+ antiporter NhaD/arsenite permease-like protein
LGNLLDRERLHSDDASGDSSLTRIMMNFHNALTLTIFTLTYFTIARGAFPTVRIDRSGAAFVGAVAMIVTGALSGHQALLSIDFRTLTLLLGMMIVIAYLRVSGAFSAAARLLLVRVRSGYGLLAATTAIAGVLAAFFINDVVCLALTPLVIEAADFLETNPTPYLLALAMATNAGSVATVTGNPQNMIVAGFADLAYLPFAIHLAPVAIASLVIVYAVIGYAYRKQLHHKHDKRSEIMMRARPSVRALMVKASIVGAGTLVCFVADFPVYMVALGAAATMMVIGRVRPKRIYGLIDWTMLLLFAGLFIVVEGAQATGLFQQTVAWIGARRLSGTVTLALVSAALSNIVSNVPAVLLFRPVYPMLTGGAHAAFVLASATTLAGNLTVVGSIANLIVLEQAHRHGIRISFYEYLRVGIPVTLLTLIGDILFLSIWH